MTKVFCTSPQTSMKYIYKKALAVLILLCSSMAFAISVCAQPIDEPFGISANGGKGPVSNVTLDGIFLSDYTYPLAYQMFTLRVQRLLRDFELKVIMNGTEYYLYADDISLDINTMDLLYELWFSNEEKAVLSAYTYDEAYVQAFADNIVNELRAIQPPAVGRPFLGYDLNTSTFLDQIHKKIADAISVNSNHRAELNIKSSPQYASPTPAPASPPASVPDSGRLSTYTTYTTNVPNRNHNIRLACEILSGTIVRPGATFSFNKTLGYTSKARGFLEAGILINGKPSVGMGGGICQISSTMYNAVLDAGLRVVERHPHSAPVDYVPKGRDATVNYGSADFRFQNNTPNDLTIICEYNNRTLTVSLYGKK